MGFDTGNILNIGFVMKFVELVFTMIVFLLYRLGGEKLDVDDISKTKPTVFPWGNGEHMDLVVLGAFVSVGYFFMVILILVGMVMGDKAKIQNLLFNLFGFLFFIGMGAQQIEIWGDFPKGRNKDMALSMGSMAIITSIIFLVDTVFSGLGLKSAD